MSTTMAITAHPRSRTTFAVLAVAALVLAGCASDPADVEDRSIGESPSLQAPPPVRASTPGGSYRVVKGDTLYSIAFKRGLDYRDVAQWNGIAAPQYKILVGQELRFSPPGMQTASVDTHPAAVAAPHEMTAQAPVPAANPAVAAPAPSAPKSTSMFEDVPNEPAPPPIEQAAAPTSALASKPQQPVTLAQPPAAPVIAATPPPVAAPAAKNVAESPPSKPANESASSNVGGITWHWPNGGKVVGTFVAGDQTKQGVDIAGSAGDPVQAAADGDVVYSGNGLLGYGELIIVKHNASFLSAYGHNRKRLVAEGDKVRAGQQIAEMGSSASSRDELHFEIRKNGKPVNPLDFLPPR
ncbi:peptidoglycan DD-metalloendopeptidase family protein [Rudaea cellulosilytica]|uniref:peptidoglycan DD-metalloendopeptidase family protein n=1 Tax=Rudaea cellulosilytica TaxID=540746 RepID=UPI001FE1A252|nr:peptidoglycan DD-metalloendopeptidase family protein [Rudaea cellulosilytica]